MANQKGANGDDASASKPKATRGAGRENTGKAQNKAQNKDAIALLKEDHRKVEKLFAAYENADEDTKKASLAREICKELIVHTELEEKLFYPACREVMDEDGDEDLDEAQVEHDSAKFLIAELLSGDPGDEYYDAKVTVLREIIRHHVAEEERATSGIFARAKKADIDLEKLGRQISEQKQNLTDDYDEERPRAPQPRSFGGTGSAGLARRNREETPMANRQGYYDERDDQGRFVSDDDRRGGSRSMRSYRDDDRYDDERNTGRYRDRDDGGRFQSRRDDWGDRQGYGGDYDDDDRRGRSRSGRSGQGSGWYGDREEHARAARQGSRTGRQSQRRDDDDYGRYSDDDDRGYGGRGMSRDQNGRYQSQGRDRQEYRGRDYDDDYEDDRSGGRNRGSGWYGDSEGHARAARRGWRDR